MMRDTVIFVAGAVIGGVAAYFYAKRKYEAICEEEIESMKEFYMEPHAAPEKKEEEKVTQKYRISDEINRAKANYAQLTQDYMEAPDPDDVAASEMVNNPYPFMADDSPREGIAEAPYVIAGEQFVNEKRNFDKITLMYYAGNGVLVDQTETVQQDIDEVIGRESLNHFGESEEDTLYVRNENLNCDYEVLYVPETYKPPYPTEEDDIY